MLRYINNPLEFLAVAIAFLIAITVHEYAHAKASDNLGDPTARLMGRLSLNPLAHLDMWGTLMLLFAPFGWAKPVPVDIYNLRNPKRDSALISLAGPASNLIIAAILAVLNFIISDLSLFSNALGLVGGISGFFLQMAIILNVNLAIFNLIPIHPLDGFEIVHGLLPDEYARQWKELEPYGIIFLLFLVFPVFDGTSPIFKIISPIINLILSLLLPAQSII